jgi:hypothetical protein
MTNATEVAGIRELTTDEIAAVSGGAAFVGPPGIVEALSHVAPINPPAPFWPPSPIWPPQPIFGTNPGSLVVRTLFTVSGGGGGT